MTFYCIFLDALDSFFNHVEGVQVGLDIEPTIVFFELF
jgi:hypothetical protein